MKHGVAITVTDNSQVGEARRVASALAERIGYDETQRGAVALVVTEAGNNLLRHGGGGELLIQAVPAVSAPAGRDAQTIQILALDRGQGMRNVAESLRDGHSTGGTSGEGLGAIRRHSSLFDIYSAPGQGTVLLSQIPADTSKPSPETEPFGGARPGGWEIGVISIPKTGETACGDNWAAEPGRPVARFLLADGLGHGPLAAEASLEAVRIFEESPAVSPQRTMENIHAALRATRGAAASFVSVDLSRRRVRFVGVGNVAGALIDPADMMSGGRMMASHNGTLGAQAYRIHEFEYPLAPSGTLILASDGLSAQWHLERYPGLIRRHPAMIAGVLYRDCVRGRDDATILVARTPSLPAEAVPSAEAEH